MVFRTWPVILSDSLFREITRHDFVRGNGIIKIKKILCFCFYYNRGHEGGSGWLRHCATSWKVMGSILDDVI